MTFSLSEEDDLLADNTALAPDDGASHASMIDAVEACTTWGTDGGTVAAGSSAAPGAVAAFERRPRGAAGFVDFGAGMCL